MPRRSYEFNLCRNGVQLQPSLKTPLPMTPDERQAAIGWLFATLRKVLEDEKAKEREAAVVVPKSTFTKAGVSPVASLLPEHLKVPMKYEWGKSPIVSKEGSKNVVSNPQYAGFTRTLVSKRLTQQVLSENSGIAWVNSRSGVDLPNHKALIHKGSNATTPLTASRLVVEATSGFVEGTWQGDVVNYKVAGDAMAGCFTGEVPLSSTDGTLLALCNTKALSKFHRRLSEIERHADVGESLAEFRQAQRMVGRPLAGMRDLLEKTDWQIRKVAMSRFGSPAKTRLTTQDAAKAAAKIHLEFTFGWKPLAMDLQAAFESALQSRLKVCPSVINASFSNDKLVSDTATVDPYLNYFRLNKTRRDTLRCTVRYKVGLSPEKSAEKARDYWHEIGLSPDRFIPTIYAVIPYSWLFDYFTALNVAIDALCADLSYTTWTCKTVRWERKISTVRSLNTAAVQKALGSLLYSLQGSPFQNTSTLTSVTRSIPNSLTPDLITLQGIKSDGQAKNIVALILANLKTAKFLR